MRKLPASLRAMLPAAVMAANLFFVSVHDTHAQKTVAKQQSIGGCENCDAVCNDRSQYFRIYSENDFFKLRGSTDRYFTNGIKLEFFFLPHGTQNGLLDKAFPVLPFRRNGLPNSRRNNNFSLAFGMNQYTPTDITKAGIIPNDRPYAGWMFLAARCLSNDYGTAERLTTEYSLGMIGPAAQQKFVQTKWHEWLNFQKPMGWDNQIHNDLAANINLQYERGIVNPTPNIEMMGNFEANVGTVTNYFGVGTTFRVGLFNDYFLNEFGLNLGKEKLRRYNMDTCPLPLKRLTAIHGSNIRRKFQLYCFIKTSFRAVIDNSLLQGGIFTHHKSPYTIPADMLRRFYAHNEFGVCLAYDGFGITFSQLFRTPEFRNAFNSHWGAVTLTVRTR